MVECFLTNLYSIDVMAPFCLELQKRGINCHLALDELFWKISYGEHFDINKAIKKAKEWNVKLNLRLDYDVKIAVTQWTSDWMLFGLYKNLKAHISYGVSINKNTIFIGYKYKGLKFDIFFVHGDFEEELLLQKGIDKKRIIKIGFPKLKYQSINFKINKNRPIITYLPTWDEYKCIDMAIDKLITLKDNYDIYLKPHPLQSNKDLEKLSVFNVLSKDVTIKSIVNFSNYIFVDLKSGVLFDAIYYGFKNIQAFSYSKDLYKYYSIYEKVPVITENNLIDLNLKLEDINKNYFFNEEWNNLDSIFFVKKISETLKEEELDILIKRLKNTYKSLYNE